MAALRRPGPCGPPGAPGKASSSYPSWTASEEAKDGDSSVSSGRLSGSSGGHESCAPPHRPWVERPPQVLGPPRQRRESSPRLEQLRDKIRAQVRWQGSCASLGTSLPSSAACLHRASTPAPGGKVQRLKKSPPAPAYPIPRENPKSMRSCSCKREKSSTLSTRRAAKDKDSELVGVHAWRRGQALARGLLGPPPALPGLQSKAASREPAPTAVEAGGTEKSGTAGSPAALPWTPSPAVMQVPPSDQAVTIQSALDILQDLRRQIQAGLELARDHQPRVGCERHPSPRSRQELAGRRPQGPCRAPGGRSSFSKSPRTPAKGMHPSSERAGGFPRAQRWSTPARWESCPQRTWLAQGQDPAFQRPGSSPERPSYFPQRPWSASAGQRAWATCEDWVAPAQGPWNPLERPSAPAQRPWSASLTKRPGSPFKGRGSLLPPWGAKSAWLSPAPSTPRGAPGKDNEARPPPPCPKPRGLLGRPYSPESLREFMRQKALVRRQQVLEEKASAARALELRNRRLQDIYRKQREAVLGKAGPSRAAPVVSQTNPSIVTFVPHPAQSRDPEVSGSLGSPVLQWSKVTSGMVLGDQEAPGSFCLCLNRPLNGAETLEMGSPQEGWEGAPLLSPASSSLGPPRLQDLTAQHPRPGLCIYLDPEEAARLGTPGPLHFRYKQARLQALETMANILKQRIDILTAKLARSEATDAPGDPVLDLPPSLPSAVPTAPTPTTPARPRALLPSGGRGAPWDAPARPLFSPTCCPDGEALRRSPGWEPRRAVSPGDHPDAQPQGFLEDGHSELDGRRARTTAFFRTLSPWAGSSLGVPAPSDLTCGPLWLEETPLARGAALVTPWTVQSGGQPGQPRARPFTDVQQKSLSFLRSLEQDQQSQQRALALLRRRAELEAWETRRALDELLFKHRLEGLMGSHATQAGPGAASELEGLRDCEDPDAKAPRSTGAARPRSQPPLGRDAAVPSWGPEEGRGSQAGQVAPAEPMEEGRLDQALSQLRPAGLYPGDSPIHQMLQQILRDQELRAQHQAALLRLREKALEEKLRSELACREHQTRCLGSKGSLAALVALAEQQRQVLRNLEQEQREIRYLRSRHLFSHHERTLLLQHHWDILSVQRSLARLQQELQVTTRLLQGSGPKATDAWDGGSETGRQPEGPALGSSRPPTPRRPGSPASHRPHASPESPRVSPLVTEQQDRLSPGASSAADGHLRPLRPAWVQETPAAEGWPDAQSRLGESGSCAGQGDPRTSPGPWPAEAEARALTEGHAWSFRGRNPHSPGGAGPCSPREASQAVEDRAGAEAGLDLASSPEGEAPATDSPWPEERRTETCWQEDPHGPSPQQEASQLATCPAPAAAEETTPPAQRPGSPLPQLTAPSGTHSRSSGGSCTPSSVSDLSCPSLQEFQKVSALLVQLSESSSSLSEWEAGDCPDADPGWSGGSSPRDSGGLRGGGGQATQERPAGGGAGPPHGSSTVSGALVAGPGLLQQGRQPLLPDAPSPRVGAELSEASSEVWKEEGLLEPGTGAQPPTGCASPAQDSYDLENGGAPRTVLVSLGPGGGQEASGTSGSLTSGSDTGRASRTSPKAACAAVPSSPGSCRDLDLSLSFPSGSSASKGADFSKGGEPGPLQTSAGCAEGLGAAGLRAPTAGKPPQAPPGDPCVLAALSAESQAPGHTAPRGAPTASLGTCVLPEITSPVDEVLSYGSADLPSSIHRNAHLPPPPPALWAESEVAPSPHSEDFPSPPEDVMCPEGSLSAPEEGASINTCDLSSLSEEGPPEAPSLGPQEASLFLGTGGWGLGDQVGESSSVAGSQAVGGQWSESVGWLGSPLCEGAGNAPGRTPRLSAQSPPLSPGAPVAGEGLRTLWTAGGTGLSGTWQGDPAPALDVGPCPGLPGVHRTQVVHLVSTQLTRRILCDTLAALSGLAPPGSLQTEELAGARRVPRPHPGALGSLGDDETSEKRVDGLW